MFNFAASEAVGLINLVSFWTSLIAFTLYFVLDLGGYKTGPLQLVVDILRLDKEDRAAKRNKLRQGKYGGHKNIIPVIEGRSKQSFPMDLLSLNRYLPPNYIIDTRPNNYAEAEVEISRRLSASGAQLNMSSFSPLSSKSTEDLKSSSSSLKEDSTVQSSDEVDEEGVPLALLPHMPGCEVDGPAVKEFRQLYPDASLSRCVRFLVARKGNVKDASSMMDQHLKWRQANYPIKRTPGIEAALAAKAFVVGGKTKNGDPVVFFRGAYYDTRIAKANDYCLAAAHAMDCALAGSGRLQVVVVALTGPVEGERNEPADIDFLKGFVNTLSNNFPERMQAAYIFPFPFFGRVIWSVVKVCMDPRSQGKIKCLGYDKPGLPPEVLNVINIDQVPEICRGTSKTPPLDLLASLADPD